MNEDSQDLRIRSYAMVVVLAFGRMRKTGRKDSLPQHGAA